MDQSNQHATLGEGKGRNALELVESITDKHLDLFRPSARWFKDLEKGKYSPIRDEEGSQLWLYDKPLPCFGCGIGWFSFLLLGFLCPLIWYYATMLYLGSYYRNDPRERSGLAASAIAALACSVILFIVLMILVI